MVDQHGKLFRFIFAKFLSLFRPQEPPWRWIKAWFELMSVFESSYKSPLYNWRLPGQLALPVCGYTPTGAAMEASQTPPARTGSHFVHRLGFFVLLHKDRRAHLPLPPPPSPTLPLVQVIRLGMRRLDTLVYLFIPLPYPLPQCYSPCCCCLTQSPKIKTWPSTHLGKLTALHITLSSLCLQRLCKTKTLVVFH